MEGLILDLILLAIVLLLACLGARKGLVLSLCSLVAVVVGLVGGSIISDYLAPPLTEQFTPMVESFLTEQLASGALLLTEGDGLLGRVVGELYASGEWMPEASGFVHQLALSLTQTVLRPVLFLISFVAVLILWYFFSHALDLVAHLPILSTINTAGGLLFGTIHGGLLMVVAALLIRHFEPAFIPTIALKTSLILNALQDAPSLF